MADGLGRKAQHGLNTMISTQPDILGDLQNTGIFDLVFHRSVVVSIRNATFDNRRH